MDQTSQLEGHVPAVLHQHRPGGAKVPRRIDARSEECIDHLGEDGRGHLGGLRLVGGACHRGIDGGPLAGKEVAAQTGDGQGGGQCRPAPQDPVRQQAPVIAGLFLGIERVEADGTPGAEGHRRHTPCLGQRAVLPLGVDHPGMAPEDGLAPEVRLDEGALPPSDLPEHHHVGIGDHAPPDRGRTGRRRRSHRARPSR